MSGAVRCRGRGRPYGNAGGLVCGRLRAVALLLRVRVNNRNATEEPADEPAHTRTRMRTSVESSRAVLHAHRQRHQGYLPRTRRVRPPRAAPSGVPHAAQVVAGRA